MTDLTRRRLLRAAVLLVFLPLVALVVTGCGSQASKAASGGVTVHDMIKSYSFRPALLTIHRGETVIWTNGDADNHTVSSDAAVGVAFDSNTVVSGKSYRFTFTRSGTFHYHCKFHPFMKGTIVVRNK